MGKANRKRPRAEKQAGGEGGGPAPDDEQLQALRSSLGALTQEQLLALRRDLALEPFAEALRRFRGAGPFEAAADALAEAGEDASVQALAAALGGSAKSWRFTQDVEAVDASRAALEALPESGRAALREALGRGDAFCSAVKKHLGRRDGVALMKLGRPRALLLLGAQPGDPGTRPEEPGERPRKRRRRHGSKKGSAEAASAGEASEEAEESDDDSEEEEAPRKAGRGGKNNATMKFLEALREKRQAQAAQKTAAAQKTLVAPSCSALDPNIEIDL